MATERSVRSRHEAFEDAYSLVSAASKKCGRAVLLVSSYDETVRAKHALAEGGRGFGVTVSTMKAWIADLWEMYGDGRAIMESVDRALFVRRALKDYVAQAREEGERSLLELTSGTEGLIEQLVCEAATEVVDADKRPEAYVLSPEQRAAVAVAAQARRDAARAGLVEHARACDRIREWGAAEGTSVVVVGCETSVAEDRLLEAIGAVVIRIAEERETVATRPDELNDLIARLYRPDFSHPVKAGGAVRFAYPAGCYASDQVLAREIVSCAEASDSAFPLVALAAPDALAAFDALAPRLVKAGAKVKTSGMAKFAKTPFGCAWNALLSFALDPRYVDVLRAGDFALSNFSSMSVSQAYSLDARLRGWRGETVDEALTDLTAWADDDWREFSSLFAEGEYAAALDAQARWIATRLNWPEAYRAQQLRAVSVAKGVHEHAALLGLGPEDALEVLTRIVMPYEAEVGPDEGEESALEVQIGTLAQIAQGPVARYDIVVLASLDADSYPLKDEELSVDALLKGLGAWKPARRIERLRLRFAQALSMAKSRVVLHRLLNTVNADEMRPAALLEELIDCYRVDPCNPDEVDKKTGLTAPLGAYCATAGEEDLARNLDPQGEPAPLDRTADVFSTGYLEEERGGALLTPSRSEEGELIGVVLSPSAIESYLECPYKWFAQRRLRLETLDAEFGARELGNFAHAVLEALHEQLRITGLRRVLPTNLAECDRLLDWQFDVLLGEEALSFRKDALIPLTQLEVLEVENLRRDLHSYLRFEAELLPDFEPWRHEVMFGYDTPFEYAGMRIRGSIDRVDVDAGGRAVVIDYKQSVGQHYMFWPKEGDSPAGSGILDASGREIVLPRKMQALIYAQIVRRAFGLVPAAAIYVGYGKKGGVAGLYDELVLHPDVDLGGIKADRCATREMLDVLDRCEEAVAARLERLVGGDIAPRPYDADACTYCPVVQCDVRDGIAAGKEA